MKKENEGSSYDSFVKEERSEIYMESIEVRVKE